MQRSRREHRPGEGSRDSVIKAFYEEVDWKVSVAWEPAAKAAPVTPGKQPSK